MVNNLEMKEHDINILRQKLIDKTQGILNKFLWQYI